MRLFTLLAGTRHTLLLYADTTTGFEELEIAAEAAERAAHGLLDVYVIAHPESDVEATVLPLVCDGLGEFAAAYGVDGPAAIVVRPDGHLGYSGALDADAIVGYLKRTFV